LESKSSIGKSAAYLTATKLISLTIGMVTAMLLSRFASLEEYGTYSQMLLIVTLVTTIFMMGLPNSINYFLAGAENKEEQRFFLSNYYTLSTILSIAAGGVLLFASPLIVKYFNNPYIMSFTYVLMILPWINVVGGSIDNVFIVYDKMRMLSIYRISYSIAILSVIILVILFKLSFQFFMTYNIVVQAFFIVSIYIIVGNLSNAWKPRLNKDLIKKIFAFSMPLGFASIIGTLNNQIDTLMVGRLTNTETLAIYSNAAKEMPVTIIAASITAVLMPQLVRYLKNNENETALDLWKNATTLSYMFICFFVAVLFVFSPQVMSILYSDKYLPGVPVFRVYSLVLLLRVTYFGIILNSIGKTKPIFYCSILCLILNIILNYLLYSFMGIIGMAVATFISIAVVAYLQLYMTSKAINFDIKTIFPWRNLLNISIINLTLGLLFAFLFHLLTQIYTYNYWLNTIILGSLWTLLYFFLIRKNALIIWRKLKV